MKQANAVRVGDEVSLTYRGQWLSFTWLWLANKLYIAQDEDGELWAYTTEPTMDSEGFSTDDGAEHITGFTNVSLIWQNSVVQYTIK